MLKQLTRRWRQTPPWLDWLVLAVILTWIAFLGRAALERGGIL